MKRSHKNEESLRVYQGAYWFVHACIDMMNAMAKRHKVMFVATRSGVRWLADDEWQACFDPRVRLRVEPDGRRTNPLYYLARMKGLFQGVYQFKADVLHIQETTDRLVNAMLRRMRHVPLVLTVHNPSPHVGEDRHMRRYERLKSEIHGVRQRADRIIVHGQGVKDQLLKVQPELSPDRVHVVLLGAMSYFQRWNRPEYVERPETVLFFGRLHRYKGLGVLLDAWQRVRETCPQARLVIAGTGDDLANHRDRILADPTCTLEDRVISTQEIARYFAEAGIVVFPYIEATQSGPLAISLAFGKPVVVTEIGGLPEMVDRDRSGLVVPPGDSVSLADALIRLLKDEPLRQQLAGNARELGQTRFSPQTLALETEEVYRQAIKSHKGD